MEKIYYCCDCGKIRENPKKGCCSDCGKIRCKEYHKRVKEGHKPKIKTDLCPCGSKKIPGRTYCQPCITRKSVEWRKKHGYTEEQIARKNELQKARWKRNHPIKQRKRRNGSLINGISVNCKECDKLIDGWCKKCDDLYWWLKYKYHEDEEYNLKHKVRALTRSYIKAGILVKKSCEECGSIKKIQAHHEDYTRPMDIKWLCQKCHHEWHKHNEPIRFTGEPELTEDVDIIFGGFP